MKLGSKIPFMVLSTEAATGEKFANICSYLPAGRIFRFLEQIPYFQDTDFILRTDPVFPVKQI